jgi:hypothetical protein
MMNQDFSHAMPAQYVGAPCTCTGEAVGSSDRCPADFGGVGTCEWYPPPLPPATNALLVPGGAGACKRTVFGG